MTSTTTTTTHAHLSGKYLTFFLGDEEYGLGILSVQEIIGLLAITMVPGTAPWVRGVINLRGKIIPIVDLRTKFGMSPFTPTDRSCIVVANAHGVEMGIMVDRVSEVVDLPADSIESAPNLGAQIRTDYLLGIGKTNGRVKLLLDIDRAVSAGDVGRIRGNASETDETERN